MAPLGHIEWPSKTYLWKYLWCLKFPFYRSIFKKFEIHFHSFHSDIFFLFQLVEKFMTENIFTRNNKQTDLAESQVNVLESQLYVGKYTTVQIPT